MSDEGAQILELIGLTIGEMEKVMEELGQPRYRAHQVLDWLYKKGAGDFTELSNIPTSLREELQKAGWFFPSVRVRMALGARDGTKRYLFQLKDGQEVEGVLIPEENRKTVCFSTQVGCGMGCAFCATGRSGLVRNLTAGEIVDQVLRIGLEGKVRISNAVAMGQGEPLANYDQVIKAIRLMNADYALGIAARRLTISTCGLIPGIYRLAKEELQINLAVSLHSTDPEKRSELVPVNKTYPLSLLYQACKDYAETTGRRVTLEYTMIKGENDSEKDLQGLTAFAKGWLSHINLIPFNPVPGTAYLGSEKKRVDYFKKSLLQQGVPVSIRESRGEDVWAACGQLRATLAIKGNGE